jgi:hypothetical protein
MFRIHGGASRQQKPHCVSVIAERSALDVVRARFDAGIEQQLHDRSVAAHCRNGQKCAGTAPRFLRIATVRDQSSDLNRIATFHGLVQCALFHYGVGQIAGSRPNDQEYGGRPMVKTVWTLKVREVLHFNGTGSLPDEIFIEREGGERDRGSHVERVIQPQYPAFQVGQEYVLFLRKAGDSMWWSAFGPSSAYRLSRGRVEALGSSRIAVSQNGETEEAFLQTIRNVGIK